jgi:uncharacterized protein
VVNFADLPAHKRRELGRRGGRIAQASGAGHKWSAQEAREAGKKSGERRRKKKKKEE